MANNESRQQNIILENRKGLRISGVKDIDSFSESKIVLNTILGELVIRGEELHINELAAEAGELTMSGKINSLVYNSFNSNANIFRRLLR